MKTAIVILNWNGKQLLEKFLPSIVKHSTLKNVALYVADNASTDDSIDFLKSNYPQINIIENKNNEGYAKGYNTALQQIKADIFCLVNSDIEVSKNWLEPILTLFKEEPNTAIIQPKILDFKSKNKFEYAGAAGGFIDKFGYPYCAGRIFDEIETDNNQYNTNSPIFWASGACFFIRSNVFHKLKGFDEHYFAHQEEIDLCWRAQNLNFDIKYVAKSTVYHVGGATLATSNPTKTYLNFRNSLFNLVKNLPSSKVFPIIFSRLVLDGIAGVKFLVGLKPKHTLAIVKAHFSFYFQLRRMIKKRSNTAKKTTYHHTKSIVWSHFVKGKKVFTDL